METEYKPVSEIFNCENMYFISWRMIDKIHDIMMKFKESDYSLSCKFWQCDGINLEPVWVEWIIKSFIKVISNYKEKEFLFNSPDYIISVKFCVDKEGNAYVKYYKKNIFEKQDYEDYKNIILDLKSELINRYHMYFYVWRHSEEVIYSLLTAIFIIYYTDIILLLDRRKNCG